MEINNKQLKVTGILSYWVYLIVAVIFISITQCLKAEDDPRGNLVSVEWLEKILKNENVLILDTSPNKIYLENHIPGAISVNVYAFGVRETPIEIIEQLFQSVGIDLNKKVVIYDQGGTMLATRMFFSLYYHGFPESNLFILNGGLSMWLEKGLPVTKDVLSTIPKGTFKIKERNEDSRVMLDEFLTASGDLTNNVLLEALGADWHFGQTKFFDKAGHIPNAILLPSDDFFNPDKTFKSSEDIKKMLSYLGINPEQKVLTHCGGGVSASVPYFVLKFLLNYPKVKLFMESQMGWLADERGLPFWTYDEPFIMRETNWLKTWGGKMLRMYGIGKVSIIDIRSEEEFRIGHLPFAVNIPADVFKNNLTSPENLVKILGNSGVDKLHEAVIVSGAGLTKESALAFVMLEELGQEKVSVFMDSMEKCTQLGFSLTTDSTIFQPLNYSLKPGKELIVDNYETNKGLYLTVFIASGVNMPSKIPDGNVINIAYTEFLNSNGTPKEAKDIWEIISKAGISRYAEVVCISDDFGEAASNYYIFKLMGFPDVNIKL